MKIEKVQVVINEQIAQDVWQMLLQAPSITHEVKGPGQFINILVKDSWEISLRRPMSIAAVYGENLGIIYKVVGKGTKQLRAKSPKDYLNILGPLGNTFNWKDYKNNHPVLVGGGVGIAPMLWLHHTLNNQNISHDLVIGARSANEHFLTHQPEQHTYLTTDDGTLGIKGTVMEAVNPIIKNIENPVIFSCGPKPMLRTIQIYSMENSIPGQMALESYMACGVGICQGCAITTCAGDKSNQGDTKEHSYHEKYSLVCHDGPVFDNLKVVI